MRTFKDLLRFYNNLDFEPFLEALEGEGLRNSQRRGCQGAEPCVMSKTRIRTHKFQDAKMCPRVLAYDANALYPDTMEVVAQ
ncbi:unnamed protein product [Porites lobata]|uniref:DNA-directed DNA polymerase n=1 Tax=Porites lobata TaxID=104759 RepID=A0ABN8N851_9CNID|nr:unnamed protein product [Porites lobata]